MPSASDERLRLLGASADPQALQQVEAQVGGWAYLMRLPQQASFDAGDADYGAARAWLLEQVDAESEVIVTWPADKCATRVRFGAFVHLLDELWWPARDDVVVLAPEGRLLVLDHEENFSRHQAPLEA